jgi:hypothetical protein
LAPAACNRGFGAFRFFVLWILGSGSRRNISGFFIFRTRAKMVRISICLYRLGDIGRIFNRNVKETNTIL